MTSPSGVNGSERPVICANDTGMTYVNDVRMTYINETVGVIYSSEAERVLSLLFLCPCTVYTLCSHVLLLLTIIKSPSLHNVHFYMIAVSSCVDITIVTMSGTVFIQQFVSGTPTPHSICHATTVFLDISVMGFQAHIGLMAYERYVYFCHPYRYQRVMTVRRVSVAMMACYVTSFVVNAVTSLLYDRQYHASVLLCSISEVSVHNSILLFVIVVPSAIITVYSMLRIWRLIKRACITDARLNVPIQQSHKTLRMLLLLSGAYWGTIFPSGTARLAFFFAGYTWQDMDTRRYPVPVIINRVVVLLACSMSSAVNPLIYLYTRKDLRDAARKLLRQRRTSASAI